MALDTGSVTTTKVLPCTCRHEFQDVRYGRGLRLHRIVSRKGKFGQIENRCTVCFSRPHKPGNGSLVVTIQHRYAVIPTNTPRGPFFCR